MNRVSVDNKSFREFSVQGRLVQERKVKLGYVHKNHKWMRLEHRYLNAEQRGPSRKERLKLQRGEWVTESIIFLNQQKM